MFGRASHKLIALIALLSAGCGNASPRDTPVAATAPAKPQPEHVEEPKGNPQPRLPTIKLYVGTNEITAEIARKSKEIETGMMWRTSMPEMAGMLFLFPRPASRSFWMKNCPLPMTCAYIAPDSAILEIRDMQPHDERGIQSRTSDVQFVLEMNRDWFKLHNVKSGAVISTEHGPIRQTFYGR